MPTLDQSTIASERLRNLPAFIFTRLEAERRALEAQGRDVITLAVGDPDMPPPGFVIDALKKSAGDPDAHHYNYGRGRPELRSAVARFMKRRFDVDCDPDRHVQVLLGSKEGLAHLPLAVADPGDAMLYPDPCYPVYRNAAVFTGLRPVPMPLTEANSWLPDLGAIDPADAAGARLMIVNHPGNPAAATAPLSFFDDAARFASERNIVLVSDQAYSEIYFDDADKPPSLWQAPSANLEETPALEFHSLSKTFCMTGWRIAFAVGREDVIAALSKVKATHDSGAFTPVQIAAAEALDRYDDPAVAAFRETYRRRRDALVPALQRAGFDIAPPKAGFFCWGRCPAGVTSETFAERCLREAGVVLVPGSAFGPSGEGWFRIALTVPEDRLTEATERLAKLEW
jgi:LL-diaminopimelate aminotransferase